MSILNTNLTRMTRATRLLQAMNELLVTRSSIVLLDLELRKYFSKIDSDKYRDTVDEHSMPSLRRSPEYGGVVYMFYLA